jgi:hypothetical protein
MTDDQTPRLVSEQNEHEIKRERARGDLQFAIRTFVANLLRVVAGAGSRFTLDQELVDAATAFWKLHEMGDPYFARDAILGALLHMGLDKIESLDKIERMTEQEKDAFYSNGTATKQNAVDAIVTAALRLLAAKMLGQHLQLIKSEKDLVAGIRSYTEGEEKFVAWCGAKNRQPNPWHGARFVLPKRRKRSVTEGPRK